MDNIEKIKELVQNNNGILLVKEAQKNDIHRQYIKQLEETGYLLKFWNDNDIFEKSIKRSICRKR